MSGIRGNTAWWMYQKQTAKGTAATVALPVNKTAGSTRGAIQMSFAGGDISPNRVFGNLAETDSSRQIGVSYAKVGGVTGSPEAYVRDASIGGLLAGVLGADTVTGTEPNFLHVIKEGTTIPYFTFWGMSAGNTLWEEYRDCFISSLNIKTTAGEPLTATAKIDGVKATRLTADPSLAASIPADKGTVYNMNNATVELPSSTAVHSISSFDLTIDNGVSVQQTDSFTPQDVVTGVLKIELSFDMILENLEEYNKFNYGGASGTEESSKLYTTSATFGFSLGEHNSIKFILPSIAYEAFPVAPNVAGSPIIVSVKAVAQRATPIITAEVNNQIGLYL